VVTIICVMLPGCERRISLNGDVSLDGNPIQTGTILFDSVDGQGPTVGGQIEDGKYQVVGDAAYLVGKKTVRISALHKTGRQIASGPPSPPGTMVDEIKPYIPAIYNVKSGLSCEVADQKENRFDFHLLSPK
jgi:hypothetical protein